MLPIPESEHAAELCPVNLQDGINFCLLNSDHNGILELPQLINIDS